MGRSHYASHYACLRQHACIVLLYTSVLESQGSTSSTQACLRLGFYISPSVSLHQLLSVCMHAVHPCAVENKSEEKKTDFGKGPHDKRMLVFERGPDQWGQKDMHIRYDNLQQFEMQQPEIDKYRLLILHQRFVINVHSLVNCSVKNSRHVRDGQAGQLRNVGCITSRYAR